MALGSSHKVDARFDRTALAEPYQALYIHIPFCKARCFYCDFKTEAIFADDHRIDSYLKDVIRQIQTASEFGMLDHIKTVYIGGGTPTHMGVKRLEKLLDALTKTGKFDQVLECTLEANPESIAPKLVEQASRYGVNRISLGVQSFNDKELVVLGRIHGARTAHEALETILRYCRNVSIDLICGIPGQSLSTWQATLEQALSHGISHVSIYPLVIEENTALKRAILRADCEMPDEDSQAEMMLCAQDFLGKNGFERYEVASYSRVQQEEDVRCHHNIAYWTGTPYLGLGNHAASMRVNAQTGMRERLMDGEATEYLSPERASLEDVMLAMRMVDGIECTKVEALAETLPSLADTFVQLEGLGLIEKTSTTYIPTTRGWLLGNELYSRIWDVADTM